MTWFAYALLSAVLFGAAGLVEKKILIKEHSLEFSAVFAVVVAVFSLPFLFFVGHVTISLGAFLVIVVCSLFGSISFYYGARCIRHMELSTVSPLFAAAPAFTAVLAFAFLGESLTRNQIAGIFLLVFGAYVLQMRSGMHLLAPLRDFWRSKYLHLVGISLVCYGIADVLGRLILTRYGVEPTLFFVLVQLLVALELVIAVRVSQQGMDGLRRGFRLAGPLIVLLSLFTVGHRYFHTQAAALAFIGLVSAIKRSSSFFVALIGGELFHETHLLRKSIAAAIIVFAVVLIMI